MTAQLPPVPHVGCNLLFLAEVLSALADAGIAAPVLFRASEMDKLDRILAHGTDRAGYPGARLWTSESVPGIALPHEDVILATTEDDIRRGEREPDFSTSFKKFGLFGEPLLLVYDARALEHLHDKHYRFRAPARKGDALLATIEVDLQGEIPGWFSAEDGACYRRLVGEMLDRRPAPARIVEVGCWAGRSTAWIARLCTARGARLVAVDHHRGSSDDYDARYRALLSGQDVPALFRQQMAALGADVRLLQADSTAAAQSFAPASLDLVFLDASHDRHAVACDLDAWWPRIAEGGVLAGHDHDAKHPGVIAAVDDFAAARGLACGHGGRSIWWLRR